MDGDGEKKEKKAHGESGEQKKSSLSSAAGLSYFFHEHGLNCTKNKCFASNPRDG